jgi:hypothetical protein
MCFAAIFTAASQPAQVIPVTFIVQTFVASAGLVSADCAYPSYGRTPHVYRIFFTVDHSAKVVRVVHVRRGARQRPAADNLRGE